MFFSSRKKWFVLTATVAPLALFDWLWNIARQRPRLVFGLSGSATAIVISRDASTIVRAYCARDAMEQHFLGGNDSTVDARSKSLSGIDVWAFLFSNYNSSLNRWMSRH